MMKGGALGGGMGGGERGADGGGGNGGGDRGADGGGGDEGGGGESMAAVNRGLREADVRMRIEVNHR